MALAQTDLDLTELEYQLGVRHPQALAIWKSDWKQHVPSAQHGMPADEQTKILKDRLKSLLAAGQNYQKEWEKRLAKKAVEYESTYSSKARAKKQSKQAGTTSFTLPPAANSDQNQRSPIAVETKEGDQKMSKLDKQLLTIKRYGGANGIHPARDADHTMYYIWRTRGNNNNCLIYAMLLGLGYVATDYQVQNIRHAIDGHNWSHEGFQPMLENRGETVKAVLCHLGRDPRSVSVIFHNVNRKFPEMEGLDEATWNHPGAAVTIHILNTDNIHYEYIQEVPVECSASPFFTTVVNGGSNVPARDQMDLDSALAKFLATQQSLTPSILLCAHCNQVVSPHLPFHAVHYNICCGTVRHGCCGTESVNTVQPCRSCQKAQPAVGSDEEMYQLKQLALSHAWACHLSGDRCMLRKEYRQALVYYKKAAELDYALSLNTLGIFIAKGECGDFPVGVSYSVARELFEAAVKQGMQEASVNLNRLEEYLSNVEADTDADNTVIEVGFEVTSVVANAMAAHLHSYDSSENERVKKKRKSNGNTNSVASTINNILVDTQTIMRFEIFENNEYGRVVLRGRKEELPLARLRLQLLFCAYEAKGDDGKSLSSEQRAAFMNGGIDMLNREFQRMNVNGEGESCK